LGICGVSGLMATCLLIGGFATRSAECLGDVVLFSENMGTATADSIDEYTGWQNQGVLSFTGTGDVRITTQSDGYEGASGASNVFLTGSGSRTFQIGGIDTTGFLPNTFNLAFGAYKSTTASDMSELILEYSSDGSNYSPLNIPSQPTGSGTANWRLITLENLDLPQVANLRLRWTNAAAGTLPQFRLDDVSLSATAIPEPAAAVLLGAIGLSALAFRRRRGI